MSLSPTLFSITLSLLPCSHLIHSLGWTCKTNYAFCTYCPFLWNPHVASDKPHLTLRLYCHSKDTCTSLLREEFRSQCAAVRVPSTVSTLVACLRICRNPTWPWILGHNCQKGRCRLHLTFSGDWVDGNPSWPGQPLFKKQVSGCGGGVFQALVHHWWEGERVQLLWQIGGSSKS